MTASDGLISIITPTYRRPAFLRRLRTYVSSQTYADLEWLILDDSPEPDADFQSLKDPRVRYVHSSIRATVGAKRNALVEASRGSCIVQFDDDDYYRPDYIVRMLDAMRQNGADIVNLSGWFLLDLRWNFFGYWDLRKKDGLHYCCDRDTVSTVIFDARRQADLENNEFGYGFTYAFRRHVWEACKFPDLDLSEDSAFFLEARGRFRTASLRDDSGICLHILHRASTSRCFPQYRLPGFLFGRLFPEGVARC